MVRERCAARLLHLLRALSQWHLAAHERKFSRHFLKGILRSPSGVRIPFGPPVSLILQMKRSWRIAPPFRRLSDRSWRGLGHMESGFLAVSRSGRYFSERDLPGLLMKDGVMKLRDCVDNGTFLIATPDLRINARSRRVFFLCGGGADRLRGRGTTASIRAHLTDEAPRAVDLLSCARRTAGTARLDDDANETQNYQNSGTRSLRWKASMRSSDMSRKQ